MQRRLRSPLEVDLLETDFDMRAVDDDTRIRLGRVAERRQPGNLFVVVRPDVEAVQRRRPEPSKSRRRGTVDHDLLQASHRPVLARLRRPKRVASALSPMAAELRAAPPSPLAPTAARLHEEVEAGTSDPNPRVAR